MSSPTKDTVIGSFKKEGNSDIFQIIGEDSSVVTYMRFDGGVVGASRQTARVSTTINPGFSTVDLLWSQPFLDDSYFVTFPNPPFAPGEVAPVPPANTKTDAMTSSLSGNWTAQLGVFDIDGTAHALELKTADSGTSRASMFYADANWAANQYSQLKITALSVNNNAIGPAVFVQDLSYYGFYVDSSTSTGYLFKQAGLITTVINSGSVTLAVNDVLYLEIAGQTLTAKQNGNVVLTGFETVPLTNGDPGIQGYQTGLMRATNWQGGNLQLPVINVPVVLGPWIYLSTGRGIRMTLQNPNTIPLQVQIDAIGQV